MTELIINIIEVPVTHLEQTSLWYQRVFQLSESWSDEGHALLESTKENDLGIRFLLVKTEDSHRLAFSNTYNSVEHSVVDFKVNNIEEFRSHLLDLGENIPPIAPPPNDWSPIGFSFCDPSGNRFGVFTYQKTKL